jgi:hypothetical protein
VVETQPTLPPAAGAECSALLPTCHVPNAGAAASLRPRARAPCRGRTGKRPCELDHRLFGVWARRLLALSARRGHAAEPPLEHIGAPTLTRKPAARTVSAIASCARAGTPRRSAVSSRDHADHRLPLAGRTGERVHLLPRPHPRAARRLRDPRIVVTDLDAHEGLNSARSSSIALCHIAERTRRMPYAPLAARFCSRSMLSRRSVA